MTGWSTRRRPFRFVCHWCRGEVAPPDRLGVGPALVSWCSSCRAEVTARPDALFTRELDHVG